jgi:hypothetical protein
MAAITRVSLPGSLRRGRSAPVRFRVDLSDGLSTTVHLAAHDLRHTDVRVVSLARPEPLVTWCRRTGVPDALVGGFFVTATGRPLGELRLAGVAHQSIPFKAPWGRLRACVHVADGFLRLAHRPLIVAEPGGDLLQAGPLLVHAGQPVAQDGVDSEGFAADREQFDSDITAGRHPRAALGVAGGIALSVVCDGRGPADAGLTLGELAELMAALGAHEAINLDGGGSATLVCGAQLVNRPREQDGTDIAGGRAVSTAVVFTPNVLGEPSGTATK